MNYIDQVLIKFSAGMQSNCIDTILFGRVCDSCNGDSIRKILSFILGTFTIGVGLLATIGIIHGAILIITSANQDSGRAKGIKRITQTLVGLAVYATFALTISLIVPGGDLNALLNPDESSEGCSEAGAQMIGDGTVVKEESQQSSSSSSSGGSSSGSQGNNNTPTQTDKPILPLAKNSDQIPCDPRTKFIKTYEKAHVGGSLIKITLCQIPNINGEAYVNSRVSGAYYAMAEAYKKKNGTQLTASQSFRSYEKQLELYENYKNGLGTYAAYPGESPHEGGLAIDFSIPDGDMFIGKKTSCDSTPNWNEVKDNQQVNRWHYTTASHWFCDNLKKYGLQRPVTSEVWHVTPTTNYY